MTLTTVRMERRARPAAAQDAAAPGGLHHAPARADRTAPGAMIGPNSLIQTLRTLEELHGARLAREIAAEAECPLHLESLVDERHFVRLVRTLHHRIGPARAVVVLAGAGRRTGEYVRANRIPRIVAGILPRLPARIGLPLLLRAFERNAWTFVGSGVFRWSLRDDPALCIDGCITCHGLRSERPLGSFYAAAFESLIRSVVDTRIGVTEDECVATGGATCRFRIHIPASVPFASLSLLPQLGKAPCASS